MNFFCCGSDTSKDKKKDIKTLINTKDILLNLDPSINLIYNESNNKWQDVPKTNSHVVPATDNQKMTALKNQRDKLNKKLSGEKQLLDLKRKKLEQIEKQLLKTELIQKLGQIVINKYRLNQLQK